MTIKPKSTGVRDNTLVIFLSDNGGCAEFLAEDSNTPDPVQFDTLMWNGERMRMGNRPDIDPGPADTFHSYDLPWANASNTPFRLHKRWLHEGVPPPRPSFPGPTKSRTRISSTSRLT